MTDGQTSFTKRVSKNKHLPVTSLGSRILLILSYLFNQNVKEKKKIRIYKMQGLQRAAIKSTRVLQILSEYLIHVRQTHLL